VTSSFSCLVNSQLCSLTGSEAGGFDCESVFRVFVLYNVSDRILCTVFIYDRSIRLSRPG